MITMESTCNSVNLQGTEELLKRTERLLHSSAEVIHILLSEKDFNAAILHALGLIGTATDVDRVYIFENHPDDKTGKMLASQRYEWARAGVAPQIGNKEMQNLHYLPIFKRWHDSLSAGKPILGLIRDFPEHERPLLESQAIISIMAVPIQIDNILWGFIGFDDCRRERCWTATEVTTLTTIATNIGYVLLQRRADATLMRFQAAIDATGDAIGMADMQGRHFYQNAAFTNLFEYTLDELDKAGGPMVLFYDKPIGAEMFKIILAGGSWHGELIMRNRSGRLLSILLRADAIKDETGKPFAVIGIHKDITERKETERKIQESEIRYKHLIESTTDYIYTVNVDNGRILSTHHGVNCITVTGYSSDEYRSDPNLWIKMVHPEDRQRVIEQAQRILKGDVQPIEHRIFHKNGSIRWVRNTPVPHFDASGKLISYDGLIHDITERKNAEEQLKEHARKLELLNRIITALNRFDNLALLLKESLSAAIDIISFNGGGIYLVNTEHTCATLLCQQGMDDRLGAKTRHLRLNDASCRLLFAEGKAIFADDDRIVSTENDARWDIQSVARIPLVSSNKVIGILALVSASRHNFNEKEKELLMAIGHQIGTAIAKMRSEMALRESERKYRTITEQSLVGIQIIKDNAMIFVNDGWTRITGYTLQDIADWQIDEHLKIIHPDDRALFIEQARKKQLGVAEGLLPTYECRYLSKHGLTKWVSIHSKAVEFADGRAIVGMLVDISDLKQAAAALVATNKQLSDTNEDLNRREKELLKANHEKEILLKEIHHRVKNNLQVISSLINLQIHNITDRNAVNLLKECQSRIKTIAMVHEKMYQWGDLSRVDIGGYLENLAHHISHMYLSNPSLVSIKVTAQNICLPIDQAIPCALIVNELVSNSFKYAFPDHKTGEINVSLSADSHGGYVLRVSDNGVGMPSGVDYRKTTSLGMQLVTTFASQLRGTIVLENKPGTAFIIRFAQSQPDA